MKRAVIAVIFFALLQLNIPAYADDEAFKASINDWQAYYNNIFDLVNGHSYSCDWEYLANNKSGDEYYYYRISEDEYTIPLVTEFVKSDNGDTVSSIDIACFLEDDCWNDDYFKGVITVLIYSGLNAIDDYDSMYDVGDSIDGFSNCLEKYRDKTDLDSKYTLLGQYGSFGVSYIVSDESDVPDSLELNLATNI